MKLKRFVVVGVGPFPFDMLRYDACWPATSEDSVLVAHESGYEPRQVTLETVATFVQTPERWKSFNWRIVQ